MTNAPTPQTRIESNQRSLVLVLGGLALVRIILHGLAIQDYGYFRDELYYIASTRHLALGFVDHPPLSIYILAAQTALFGDSLVAIRSLSILAGAGIVVLSGLLVREIGGGLFAVSLSALAIALTPVSLGSMHFFSMNAFDQFIWSLAVYLFVRLLKTNNDRLWLLLGVVLGLGLFNKISVFWLGSALLCGLLFTKHRGLLKSRGPWIAGAVALLVFLPYVIWQLQNGFPTLEFIRNASELKMRRVGIGEFLSNHFLAMNPVATPVYIAGLVGFFVVPELKKWKILGIMFLTVTGILLLSGSSKTYYLAAAYPLLLVPGAVAIGRVLSHGWKRYLGAAYLLAILASGLAIAPLAIPLLPPEKYIRYSASLGIRPPAEERHQLGSLPQHFADMFGWQELAEEVANAYRALDPEEQAQCIIVGQNYGEAGAIDVLGRRLGLPGAISPHNSYWIWGPGETKGEVVIIIGGNADDNASLFEQIEQVGVVTSTYSIPHEQNLPIYVARRLKEPIKHLWPRLKMFI